MNITTRSNPSPVDGTPGNQAGTGTHVEQSPLPSNLPQNEVLRRMAKEGAEQAFRADATGRARLFRYGGAADEAGVASDASGFIKTASTIGYMDELQDLIAKVLESAKASATGKADASLVQHYQALETAATSVAKWSSDAKKGPLSAEKGLRALLLAYVDMPQADETSLGETINTAYEDAFSARELANQVDSAQSLVDKLWHLNVETRSWPDLARGVAFATFLEGAALRLVHCDDVAEAHQQLSEAITLYPRWISEGADAKLCELEAGALLRPSVKAGYEHGERLVNAARSISDLAALHALLLEPGIVGPDVPDDLLGLARMSDYDGNPQLLAWPRPEPLAAAATRVGSFATTEANQHAFADIFDRVDTIEPPCRRIASLTALAGAASRLADPAAREQGYMRVQEAARTLRASQQITSEQQALVERALQQARYDLAA